MPVTTKARLDSYKLDDSERVRVPNKEFEFGFENHEK